jgi:tRNA(Ile)-lysidine synthase
MYINHYRTLPKDVYVAFSGGVDSVVLVHSILARGKNPTLAFYHHGNEYADVEETFVTQFAEVNRLHVVTERCTEQVIGSKEEFWRKSRHQFFHSLDGVVATGQNLNDAAEWYLFTTLRGNPTLYTYENKNVVKPLMLYSKSLILQYAQEHNLQWIEDPSNQDEDFGSRNRIRNNILPECLKVNPGFLTTIRNMLNK